MPLLMLELLLLVVVVVVVWVGSESQTAEIVLAAQSGVDDVEAL